MVQKDRITDFGSYGSRAKSTRSKERSNSTGGNYRVKYYARENPTYAKTKEQASRNYMNPRSKNNPTSSTRLEKDNKSRYHGSRDDSEYSERGRTRTEKRCTTSFDSIDGWGMQTTSSSSIASNLVPPPSFFETLMACAGWDGGYRPHDDLYDYDYDYGYESRRTRSLSFDRSIKPRRGSRSLSSDGDKINWRSGRYSYDSSGSFDSFGTSRRSSSRRRKRSKSKRKKKDKSKNKEKCNEEKQDESDDIQKLGRSVSMLIDSLTQNSSADLQKKKNESSNSDNTRSSFDRNSLERSLSLLVEGLAKKSSTDLQKMKPGIAKEPFIKSDDSLGSADRRFIDKRVSLLEKALNQKVHLDKNHPHTNEQSLFNFAPNLRSKSPVAKQNHLLKPSAQSRQSFRVMETSPLYPLRVELSPVADDVNNSVSNPELISGDQFNVLMQQRHHQINAQIGEQQIRPNLDHSRRAPSRSSRILLPASRTKFVPRNTQGQTMRSSPSFLSQNTEPRKRKERQKLMLQQSLAYSYRGESSSNYGLSSR